jgi:hypothetical protein
MPTLRKPTFPFLAAESLAPIMCSMTRKICSSSKLHLRLHMFELVNNLVQLEGESGPLPQLIHPLHRDIGGDSQSCDPGNPKGAKSGTEWDCGNPNSVWPFARSQSYSPGQESPPISQEGVYDNKIGRLDPPVRRQACLLTHGWVGETRLLKRGVRVEGFICRQKTYLSPSCPWTVH